MSFKIYLKTACGFEFRKFSELIKNQNAKEVKVLVNG